jgi:flavin-dependent dehydrogenase
MSRAERADVVVIGGGPTGLAAAIEGAMRGFEVALFEPRPAPIDKACGEGLMPSARTLLSELGVEVDGKPFLGIRYVDALDPKRSAEGTFPFGAGIGVRRTRLHHAMHARARELGVRFIEQRVHDLTEEKNHVFAGEVRAQWAIVADGLHSPLRAKLGLALPPRRRPRFGVRRHLEVPPASAHVEVHFAAGCEAYVTPVDERTVGVAFLYAPPARWDELAKRFPHLHERLRGAPIRSEDRGAGPFEQRVRARTRGRILLAGDAAGYLDPLTGEGVALGIATARAAIRAIRRETPDEYERDWRRLTRTHFALTSLLLDLSRNRSTQKGTIEVLSRAPWVFDRILGHLGGAAK